MVKQENINLLEEAKVVNINEFQKYKKQEVEEWLEQKMIEIYDDVDIFQNPLLRISTKFKVLSLEAQVEILRFAKRYILGSNRNLSLCEQLWSVLQQGKSEMWKVIEAFEDEFVMQENVYKQ